MQVLAAKVKTRNCQLVNHAPEPQVYEVEQMSHKIRENTESCGTFRRNRDKFGHIVYTCGKIMVTD